MIDDQKKGYINMIKPMINVSGNEGKQDAAVGNC